MAITIADFYFFEADYWNYMKITISLGITIDKITTRGGCVQEDEIAKYFPTRKRKLNWTGWRPKTVEIRCSKKTQGQHRKLLRMTLTK